MGQVKPASIYKDMLMVLISLDSSKLLKGSKSE